MLLCGGVVRKVGANGKFDRRYGEVVADGLEVATPLVEALSRGDAVVVVLDQVWIKQGDKSSANTYSLVGLERSHADFWIAEPAKENISGVFLYSIMKKYEPKMLPNRKNRRNCFILAF